MFLKNGPNERTRLMARKMSIPLNRLQPSLLEQGGSIVYLDFHIETVKFKIYKDHKFVKIEISNRTRKETTPTAITAASATK
jgi:hypothetical protein